MRTLFLGALIGAGVLCALCSPATSQTTGTVRGSVQDTTGDPLPGVTVTVTGEQVRTERTAVTGSNGQFSFVAIKPGSVNVTGDLDGFVLETVSDVKVTITAAASVTLVLTPLEKVKEAVTVVSGAALINPTSNSVSTNFSEDLVKDLPTDRAFYDFAALAPGISRDSEDGTRFSAFGSGTSSNSWNIDGINATAGDTGNTWWYINPDMIAEIQVLGIGAPAEFGGMSGAAINVVTKSGTNNHKGRLSYFYQSDGLTSENISKPTPDGEVFPHARDTYHNATFAGGGPLKRDKLWYFAAIEDYEDAVSNPGTDPAFALPFEWLRYDAKLTAALTPSNLLEVTYHYEDYDYNFPRDAFTSPTAAPVEFGTNPAWAVLFQSVLSNNTFLEAHYSGWDGDDFWRSQTGSTEVPFYDGTQPVTTLTGGAVYPYDYSVSRDQVDVELSHFAEDFMNGDHDFKFGVQYTGASADTWVTPAFGGFYLYKYNYEYEYYGYTYLYPYYYKYEQLPHYYGSDATTLSAFVDDSWRVGENLTLNLGVRYDKDEADIPSYPRLDANNNPTGEVLPGVDDVVSWSTISPRLGLTYQMGKQRRGVLKASYGRYHDSNVTGDWNWPPPGLPTFFYSYSPTIDGEFVIFDEFTDDNVALPDPGLNPPKTDQFALSYEHQVGRDMVLGANIVLKETTDMIGWEILDDGVYEMVPFLDPVTGQTLQLASVLQNPTVRKGNRPGDGSLAPPGAKYESEYQGLVLSFNKRYTNGWSLQSSYVYSESEGRLPKPLEQTQQTPFYGGFEGADPNNHINSSQLLQADRKHVFNLQSAFELPWGFDGTAVFQYLGGRPYSLQTRVGLETLAQGGTTFISSPANDDQRLPDQTVLDFSLGRRFEFKNGTSIRFDAQVFNVTNEDANDSWESFSYARGTLVPTDWVLPRRVMLRAAFSYGD